jgi:hypothetical protein
MTDSNRVTIQVPAGEALLAAAWWPKGEVTGTVTKRHANGTCMVAVDQLRNRSADGRRSVILPAAWLTVEGR